MLQVFISIEEELTCVELDEDASHGPQVALLVPRLVLQDHFWSAVLARVNDQRVPLVLVSGPAKIDDFDFARRRLVVLAPARLLTLPRVA